MFSSSTGLSINATTGTIYPAASQPGTYQVNYALTGAGGCTSNSSASVTIFALPKISFTTPVSICHSSSAQSAMLNYTVVSATPASYTLTAAATGGMPGFTPVVNAAMTPGSIDVMVPAGTAAGTYSFNLSLVSTDGCTSPKYTFAVQVMTGGSCAPGVQGGGSFTTRSISADNKVLVADQVSEVLVAPNPMDKMLTIRRVGIAPMSVVVMSATGSEVVKPIRFISSTTLDMSRFAAGMYVVEIVNERSGERVRKMIIKN